MAMEDRYRADFPRPDHRFHDFDHRDRGQYQDHAADRSAGCSCACVRAAGVGCVPSRVGSGLAPALEARGPLVFWWLPGPSVPSSSRSLQSRSLVPRLFAEQEASGARYIHCPGQRSEPLALLSGWGVLSTAGFWVTAPWGLFSHHSPQSTAPPGSQGERGGAQGHPSGCHRE